MASWNGYNSVQNTESIREEMQTPSEKARKKSTASFTALRRISQHETGGAVRKLSLVKVTTFKTRSHSVGFFNPVNKKSWRRRTTENRPDDDHRYRFYEYRSLNQVKSHSMENSYLLPLSPPQSVHRSIENEGVEFDYEINDQDEDEFASNERRYSRRTNSIRQRGGLKNFKPAQPWPCRPCGLLLGTCHILLGLCVIVFDVATNWITETVFAITAGICFVNSGIIGLIAARKLDRGTVTLFVIFSLLSLGLCTVLIIECSASLNHACSGTISTSIELPEDMDTVTESCVNSAEATIRTCLLVFSLLEGVVGIISILIGAKSLCNRYAPDLQNPSSPYHALIYGDLVPPQPPKRIVQDIGREATGNRNERRSYSRLLLEYLVPSSPSSSGEPSSDVHQKRWIS